ncbi:MAG TPA: hypothetical protein DDZ67_06460 [Xanthomonadaceae bacterium]|nr:hypothetical protein [Xanthomonadaceae bacterium]
MGMDRCGPVARSAGAGRRGGNGGASRSAGAAVPRRLHRGKPGGLPAGAGRVGGGRRTPLR